MHNNKKCGEYGGRKTQKVEETEEFRPWLQVASPKRQFGQGSGWPRSKNYDPTYHGQSSGGTMGNRSWRASKLEDDGGRRRQRWVRRGATEDVAQGEEGLFINGNKFANKETEDYMRSDSKGFGSNAIEDKGQNIPSKEEEDLLGVHQNTPVTDYGNKYDAVLAEKWKQTEGEGRSMEGIMGSKTPQDNIMPKRVEQEMREVEEIAVCQSGEPKSRKEGGVYVGQWNQIKERMEWNLTEGTQEGFGNIMRVTVPSGKRGTIKTNELSKKARMKDLLVKCPKSGLHVGNKKSASKVGEKRRCHVVGQLDHSPVSSNVQPMAEGEEKSERKRFRTTDDDTFFTSMIPAETAL